MNAKIDQHDSGYFNLTGLMNLDSIGTLLADGQIQFTGHERVEIDLVDADCANTAGLALLLEWSTWCQAQSIKLRYKNAHRKLHEIVKVHNLEQMPLFSS